MTTGSKRVALLLDGGFVKKRLGMRIRAAPSVQDVVGHVATILQNPTLSGLELFRIYYYDAPPFDGKAVNPLGTKPLGFPT